MGFAKTERMGKNEQFWVEESIDGKPLFVFINPRHDGMCLAIFCLRDLEKLNMVVYFNTCRPLKEHEYIAYKMLGYLAPYDP